MSCPLQQLQNCESRLKDVDERLNLENKIHDEQRENTNQRTKAAGKEAQIKEDEEVAIPCSRRMKVFSVSPSVTKSVLLFLLFSSGSSGSYQGVQWEVYRIHWSYWLPYRAGAWRCTRGSVWEDEDTGKYG